MRCSMESMNKWEHEQHVKSHRQLEEVEKGVTPEFKKMVEQIVKDDDELFKHLAKR